MDGERLYFLDNLKWVIIWLMVVFHAAMCYMAYAPEWWYVVDKGEPVFSATAFVCWADIFIMPIMFFISGYFGMRSMAKYEAGRFWQGKFKRIILPWVFGSMVIAPLVTYIILASRQSPMGFWEFYTTLFWGVMYEQAQYWYLGALSALYLILFSVCRLFPSVTCKREARAPSVMYIAALFAVTALSIGIISSYMHPDTWKFFGYILVLQPVRIPSYIAVFMAGAWAWRCQWFETGEYVPSTVGWGTAFVFWGAFYLWQRFYLPYYGLGQGMLVWVNALFQAGFMWASVFFLLGFFKSCFDCSSKWLRALSATSYGVYYLHMPVLFPIAWAFVDIRLQVYVKYFLVSTLTLAICFMLGKYVMLKIPGFTVKA